MRLIDADEIRIKPDFILYGVCGTPVIRCEDLARIINDMPTIEPQKWIPVSERLPEDNGDYLVTRNRMGLYSYVDIVTKTNVVDKIASDIKAWMPLPEPYEKKE